MQNSLAVDAFIFILQKRETSGNMCFLQNKCVEQICSKDKGFHRSSFPFVHTKYPTKKFTKFKNSESKCCRTKEFLEIANFVF